jgi:DNA-binding response OmpR family regulator
VLELVGLHLRKAGYRALTFNNVPDFWRELESVTPALIVLDIMLPVENVLVICKKLRQNDATSTPRHHAHALDRELERIEGLTPAPTTT